MCGAMKPEDLANSLEALAGLVGGRRRRFLLDSVDVLRHRNWRDWRHPSVTGPRAEDDAEGAPALPNVGGVPAT